MTHRSIVTLFVTCGVLTLAAAPSAQAPAAAPRPIVLKAAHLFDGVSGRLTDGAVIVVSGGKIQAVGASAATPAGAEVIDLGDATLMPGMIDSHVHMDGQSQDNWYLGFYQGIMQFPAERALYGAKYAKKTLEAGLHDRAGPRLDRLHLARPAQRHQRRRHRGPAHARRQLRHRLDRRPRRPGSVSAAAHCAGRARSRACATAPTSAARPCATR